MDPITATIVGALPALASNATEAVKSAYEGLKTSIRRKYGDKSIITKAITALEEDPESKAQAAVLEEKIEAAKAADDVEVLRALRRLVEELKAHSIGGEPVASIQFNMSGGVVQGIAGAESVHIGSMTFGKPRS
jgi:disulfide oxidoreductase YuzD